MIMRKYNAVRLLTKKVVLQHREGYSRMARLTITQLIRVG